jgi:hypothetical protein
MSVMNSLSCFKGMRPLFGAFELVLALLDYFLLAILDMSLGISVFRIGDWTKLLKLEYTFVLIGVKPIWSSCLIIFYTYELI